jgi:hypothetical protein
VDALYSTHTHLSKQLFDLGNVRIEGQIADVKCRLFGLVCVPAGRGRRGAVGAEQPHGDRAASLQAAVQDLTSGVCLLR